MKRSKGKGRSEVQKPSCAIPQILNVLQRFKNPAVEDER